MGIPRGVRAAIVRLPLSGGDWIDVKHQLTAGDEVDLSIGSLTRDPEHPGEYQPDLKKRHVARTLAYAVGWSLADLEGQPIPLTETALYDLDVATLNEVRAAVAAHHEQQELERLKNLDGVSAS